MTQREPVPAPTAEAITSMRSVWNAWWTHYYQLLFFHPKRYTGPKGSGKYAIQQTDRDDLFFLGLKVHRNGHPEFDFGIPSGGNKSQEELDEEVLIKIGLIEEAIQEGREKIHPRACCSLATITPCVCLVSFNCSLHGAQCIGTHD